jgi:hypothetical protein
MSIFSEGDLDRLRSYYPEKPGKLSHQLTGHPLLTLEALVELGKRLPRSSVEYNAGDLPYGVDPEEVSHTGLSVEDTIRGIEECAAGWCSSMSTRIRPTRPCSKRRSANWPA